MLPSLRDYDGDGNYDQSTIYVDGVASPTGGICYDGGIFVVAAPDILYCKDSTGDGLADLRQTVFTRFAISENWGGGARLNSFRWGLDNRIHACTSFSGGQVRHSFLVARPQPPPKPAKLRQANNPAAPATDLNQTRDQRRRSGCL